jgi:CHAT domain-containing protein/TPR repeat protein
MMMAGRERSISARIARAMVAAGLLAALLATGSVSASPKPWRVHFSPLLAAGAKTPVTRRLQADADSTDPEDQEAQGVAYALGRGVEKDPIKALQYFRRAADRGAPLSQVMTAMLLGTGQAGVRDLPNARRYLTLAAQSGFADAIALLAHPAPWLGVPEADQQAWARRLEGLTSTDDLLQAASAITVNPLSSQDFALSFRILDRVKAQNPVRGTMAACQLLLTLQVNERALTQAVEFSRSPAYAALPEKDRRSFVDTFAAEFNDGAHSEALQNARTETLLGLAQMGVGDAAFELAGRQATGDRTPLDYAAAARWYRLLAESGGGYYNAQVRLGQMYEAGQGVPVDYSAAAQLYLEAAKGGYGPGVYQLALLFDSGLGVAADPAQARALYLKAAEMDDTPAMVRAGDMLRLGQGGPIDLEGARRLYRQASDSDAVGRLRLGEMMLAGAGGPKSVGDGLMWLQLSASQGNAEAARKLAALSAPIGAAPDGLATQIRQRVDDALAAGDLTRASNALDLLEKAYKGRGDRPAVVRTRLERTLVDDAFSQRDFGSQENYFYLLQTACHWGQASNVAYNNGDTQAALLFAKVAVNRLQDARRYLYQLPDDVRECFIETHKDRYRFLADLFIEMGRFPEAENVLGMLKDFELLTYTRDGDKSGRAHDKLPLDADQTRGKGKADKAFNAVASLADAAQTVTRVRAIPVASRTPADQAQLGAAEGQVAAGQTAFRADLADLNTTLASLDPHRQTELEATLPSMSALIKHMDHAASLHAVVLPDRVRWLLTTAGYQKAFTINVTQPELNRAVFEVRQALQNPSVDAAGPARKLYDLVFKPVDAELTAAGVTHVMLSLDGALRYVPFAALNDGQDWLVKRYAFSQFRASTGLTLALTPDAHWTVAGFGASLGGPGFSPLPDVPSELNGIVKGDNPNGVLPGQIRLNSAFTRTELAAALHGDYKVVHVATHFALDPNDPKASFLLLGDGSHLNMDEFKLNGSFDFSNIDLLALSACETALSGGAGGGAELDSMAGIAQGAGAPAVLASLWSVSDDSTARLMQAFYREREASHLAKSDALRQAQLAVMAHTGDGVGAGQQRAVQHAGLPATASGQISKGYAHPFYWAPFVLFGNWQ